MGDLQPGDLLWTRSEGVVGALIRFGARVRYHGWRAAIARAVSGLGQRDIVEDPTDISWGNHIVMVCNGSLIEALAHGLTRSPLTKYPTYRVLPLCTVFPDVTDQDRGAAVRFAERSLAAGDRYGWLDIASIVIQLLTPLKLDLTWGSSMICSAAGARFWEHAGVTLLTPNPFTTTPADLALLALKGDRP